MRLMPNFVRMAKCASGSADDDENDGRLPDETLYDSLPRMASYTRNPSHLLYCQDGQMKS